MSQANRSKEPFTVATALLLDSLPPEVAPVRLAIFTALRAGDAPASTDVAARTGFAIVEVNKHVAALEAIGIAQRDETGRVIAADGISTTPTRHRLVLDGVRLHTWCAIDAIAIPGVLEADATTTTSCPSCGARLEVRFLSGVPDAVGRLVAWAPTATCTNIVEQFCPEANLFCNAEHLHTWRKRHGLPEGTALTVPELIEQGHAVWAQLNERR